MFTRIESPAHRLRHRLSRSEWAIQNLGLKPSEGTSEQPGLLLLQIDGLARTQLESALAHGHMPFLRRLLAHQTYELLSFYPGMPSTTPAVQAELYYGIRSAVPAFSFFRRDKGAVGMMYSPEWAREFEAGYQTRAEGLLKGGSCWSNIYTGGAAPEESHFCSASSGLRDLWRWGKLGHLFLFALLQLPAVLRITGLVLLETFVAFWDLLNGVLGGEPFRAELNTAFARIFIGTGLREIVVIGGKIDVTRGLPVVHLNFLSYDEHAHRRGPDSLFAHWSLREIDRSIKNLFNAAHRSRRRDYAVWIFSDHGQERTRSFAMEVAGGVEGVIRNCLEHTATGAGAHAPGAPVPAGKDSFTVAAVGPLGHVYFAQPPDHEHRCALARRLVAGGRIPGVLVARGDGTATWFHARGETGVPGEAAALLPHPGPIAAELARDLAAFCHNEHAGDIVLLGWSPWSEPWTFAPERGAHGGPGPDETRGFVLLPAHTRLPRGPAGWLRPETLRAAALHQLDRVPLPTAEPREPSPRFRLVTYNAHSCHGTDGRISPRRIARVLSALEPDIVAVQELDLGHRRSRAEDQSAIIARELGFHVVFCPTVTHGSEHYGHALLSRWPIHVVHRAFLPADTESWWKEARAAIWAQVLVGGRWVNIITTHLGLGRTDRLMQMRELTGLKWIGAVPPGEPLVFCGDFNTPPGGGPYRLASALLRDAQMTAGAHRPLRTFTSAHPFARIDHVFLSAPLSVEAVRVPRNHLSRYASDHLPLVIDLRVAPAAAGTTTHTPAQ